MTLVIAPRKRWTSAVAATRVQIAARIGPTWVTVRVMVRVAICRDSSSSGSLGSRCPSSITRTEDDEIDTFGRLALPGGHAGEDVEARRVDHRPGAHRLVEGSPGQDPLDRDLQLLAVERPRHLRDGADLVGHVARGELLAQAGRDAPAQAVVQPGPLPKHDEQEQPPVLTRPAEVDHQAVEDL